MNNEHYGVMPIVGEEEAIAYFHARPIDQKMVMA